MFSRCSHMKELFDSIMVDYKHEAVASLLPTRSSEDNTMLWDSDFDQILPSELSLSTQQFDSLQKEVINMPQVSLVEDSTEEMVSTHDLT